MSTMHTDCTMHNIIYCIRAYTLEYAYYEYSSSMIGVGIPTYLDYYVLRAQKFR